MPPDAVRELKHLQELHHPGIISLLGVFSSKDQNLNLVLELLPLGDLEMLIRDTDCVRYGAADIKAWMGMLSRAVWFCHENAVLHRDIKPNNLLVAADGEIKLADFGLARAFADPHMKMSPVVVTLWYRAPELLFGARHYGAAIDVWSVGLVFAELVMRVPYMAGKTEVDQVALICAAVGTPTEDNWPGVSNLPGYRTAVPAPQQQQTPVRGRDYYEATFGAVGSLGADLLARTLTLDPARRISARDMLRHDWWHAEPKPTPKERLPRKQQHSGKNNNNNNNNNMDRMGADLKRRPGTIDDDRGAKVARKLDFGMAK
jgi:cyclin-dependent kinase 7